MQKIYDDYDNTCSYRMLTKKYGRKYIINLRVASIVTMFQFISIIFLYMLKVFFAIKEPLIFAITTNTSFVVTVLLVRAIKKSKKRFILKIESHCNIMYRDCRNIYSKELKEYQEQWVHNYLESIKYYEKATTYDLYNWLLNKQLLIRAYKARKIDLFSITFISVISIIVSKVYNYFENIYKTLGENIEKVVFIFVVLVISGVIILLFQIYVNRVVLNGDDISITKERETYIELERIVEKMILK